MSDDKKYFLSLVAEDERLTEYLTDDIAQTVIEFAEYLAEKIARNKTNISTKEQQFRQSMLHVRNLSKAIVECLEGSGPVDRIEEELDAAYKAANNLPRRNNVQI